ncbi:DUF5723 family protein [Aquimarina hainanensis]|uniref:DUF5723 family protein n=1 Tax=Aquimarina hainanensis TaxID=1578017 RepID=A0ABW5NBV5_9FLAO
MRIYLYLTITLFWAGIVYCQNKVSLYDVVEIPQSLLLNPGAEVNFNYHAGIPFLSHYHVNAGLRGASVHDVFADDGRDINVKIEETLHKLTSNDYVTLTQQAEILSVGWRSKRDKNMYFSAGLYEELDLIAYFPKDFAILAYEGNRDHLNRPFRFSDISAVVDFLTVYHFGINKKIDKQWTFGARAKVYSSIFNMRSTRNFGAFTTIETPNGNNIYQHVISNADVAVKTAGYASLRAIESEDTDDGAKQVKNKFIGRALLGGNLGVGADIGFSYRFKDYWTLTGSLTDLGVIFYTKDVETYKAEGNYVFEGFETPVHMSDNNIEDFVEDFKAAVGLDTIHKSYVAMRPLKINSSIKYSFNRYDENCNCYEKGEGPMRSDALGLQLFSVFRPKRPQVAASVFYYKRLWSFLSAKVNYTVDDHSLTNVGLLLSTRINKFNFYISGNNLFEYSNLAKARGASVNFGFNLIM